MGNKLKLIKIVQLKIKYPNVNGKNDCQPNIISWSYLYLGNVARVIIKKVTPIIILKLNHKVFEIKIKNLIGNQPPKNKIAANVHISSILAYSDRKNKAKVIAEYSTL